MKSWTSSTIQCTSHEKTRRLNKVKEMTDFFEPRVENLEPKEEKKKSSVVAKKKLKKPKKRKQEDFVSSVVESSEESTTDCCPNKKYCILHDKCSYSPENCKNLHAMINKHKQKKNNFNTYGMSNKELNALIEKNFQKLIKNKKRKKIKRRASELPRMLVTDNERKKSVSSRK